MTEQIYIAIIVYLWVSGSVLMLMKIEAGPNGRLVYSKWVMALFWPVILVVRLFLLLIIVSGEKIERNF